MAVESLESRQLLAASVLDTSFLSPGTLSTSANSLTVQFSEPVFGGTLVSSYELRQAGSDGLLGSSDDPIVPLAFIAMNANTATVNFPALTEDVYRLTVRDTIIDAFGNALDGDGNGIAGGNWRRDFVVGALSTTLAAANGIQFDPEFGGSGAGQLVQGTSNAFDGLGNLRVGNANYSPSYNLSPLGLAKVGLNAAATITPGTPQTVPLTTIFSQQASSVTSVSSAGVNVTLSESRTLRLTGTILANKLGQTWGEVDFRFLVNGVRISGNQWDMVSVNPLNTPVVQTFHVEEYVTLTPGTHLISLQVFSSGTNLLIDPVSSIDLLELDAPSVSSRTGLAKVGLNAGTTIAPGTLQTVPLNTIYSQQASSVTSVSSSGINITLTESKTFRLTGTILANKLNATWGEVDFRFAVNGVRISANQWDSVSVNPLNTPIIQTYHVEEYVTLAPGTHLISLQVFSSGTNLLIDPVSSIDLLELDAPSVSSRTGLAKVGLNAAATITPGTQQTVPLNIIFSQQASSVTSLSSSGINVNLTESRTFRLSGTILANKLGQTWGEVDFRFAVDGVRISGNQWDMVSVNPLNAPNVQTFNIEEYVTLTPGTHLISLQVFSSGTNLMIDPVSSIDLHELKQIGVPTRSNSSQTVDLASSTISGLNVTRSLTVPGSGTQSFARAVDTFSNNTPATITTPVRVSGNLGSDAATTVFATSDGDLLVEPTDLWFGTDDGDGTGTPAIVHLLHGPFGQQPTSVNLIDDNVQWTYDLTVPAGATRRVAHFTVLGTTRTDAIASVNALLNINGFTGQAAAFLTSGELASLANFQFNSAPTDLAISQTAMNENSTLGSVVGNLTTSDINAGDNFVYALVSGSGDADNSSFAIVGNQLRTAVPLNFEGKNNYSVRIKSTDQGGLMIEKSLTITVVDLPELVGPAVIGDGTNQRSLVKQLVLTFDGAVTIASGAFLVDKLGAGGGGVTTNYAVATNGLGQTVVTLSFSGTMTRGTVGALTDGYYRLTVDGSKITRAGQALDSNSDGVAGDNYVLGASGADNFFALYGDIDGNGEVGVAEFGQFRSAFGKSSSDVGYNALFDFESDGSIGVSDFGQFRSRFGKPRLAFP